MRTPEPYRVTVTTLSTGETIYQDFYKFSSEKEYIRAFGSSVKKCLYCGKDVIRFPNAEIDVCLMSFGKHKEIPPVHVDSGCTKTVDEVKLMHRSISDYCFRLADEVPYTPYTPYEHNSGHIGISSTEEGHKVCVKFLGGRWWLPVKEFQSRKYAELFLRDLLEENRVRYSTEWIKEESEDLKLC